MMSCVKLTLNNVWKAICFQRMFNCNRNIFCSILCKQKWKTKHYRWRVNFLSDFEVSFLTSVKLWTASFANKRVPSGANYIDVTWGQRLSYQHMIGC